MTKATLRRIAVAPLGIALLALTSGPVLTAPVGAESGRKPVLREQIDDRFVEEPDQYVLDTCGVAVRIEGRVLGHFVLYGDLTARRHLNIEYTWSDLQTGAPLFVERDAETFFEVPISETVDMHAGTRTLVFESTIVGLPVKGIVPGEGVIIRDAGRITEVVTVVLDLETGAELSVSGQFTDVRGPHPFAKLTPAERDALFCDALT